jgi:hypothetical protein
MILENRRLIAVKVHVHTQTCIGVHKGTYMCDSVRYRISCIVGISKNELLF